MSINKIVVSGHLGADPELRETASGSVLNFSVCVNSARKNPETGAYEDVPNWVDVSVWGQYGVALSQYMAKGSKVCVSGRIRQSKWQAEDGTARSRLYIQADDVEIMTRNEQQAQPQPQQQTQQTTRPAPQPQGGYAEAYRRIRSGEAPAPVPQPQASVYDEDIPF